MENPEKRRLFGVPSILHSKVLSMLVLLAIIAAVPLTVFVAQQQQEIRQQAQETRIAGGDPMCRCKDLIIGERSVKRWVNEAPGNCNQVGLKAFDYLRTSELQPEASCASYSDGTICGGDFKTDGIFPIACGNSCKDGNGNNKPDGKDCQIPGKERGIIGTCQNGSCNPISNQTYCDCLPSEDRYSGTFKWQGGGSSCRDLLGVDNGSACNQDSKEANCRCGGDSNGTYFSTIEGNRSCQKARESCGTGQSQPPPEQPPAPPPPGGSSCQGKSLGDECVEKGRSARCNAQGGCDPRIVCKPGSSGVSSCTGDNKYYGGTCPTGNCGMKAKTCKPDGTGWNEQIVCSSASQDQGGCAGTCGGGPGPQPPGPVDPGRGGQDPSCSGNITTTCENGKGKITANWNVSSKDGNPNSCNIYVHRQENDGTLVLSNECGDNKSVSVGDLEDGNYTLYVSSGGWEGGACHNERKNATNVNCSSGQEETPPVAPPPAVPPPPATGGVTCQNGQSPPNAQTPPGSQGYKWKADCSKSCTTRDDCPKNDFDVRNVDPENSAWCYGFQGGSKCLQLVRTGCEQRGPGCTGACQAESLQPRFRVEGLSNGDWFPDERVQNPQVEANTQIFTAIFKNKQQEHAGAGTSARVTGPNGFSKTVSTTGVDSFTPTAPGEYVLSVNCGTKSESARITIKGAGSVCRVNSIMPRFQKDISSEWTNSLQNIQLGESVRVAVFKDGSDRLFAGTGTTAKIEKVSGDGRSVVKEVGTGGIETFTPLEGADYELTAICGPKAEKATLKVNGIPDCKPEKVEMTAKSVKNPSGTEIFVNEIIKFVVKGEQGQTLKKDEWTPTGIVDCTGAFFGSKLCKATGAGTVEWKHSWKNCAVGSETNCKPECSKSLNLKVLQIPNFEMEGSVVAEGTPPKGLSGLTIKIINDEKNETITTETDNSGNFTAPDLLPRGDRYTVKIEGFDGGSFKFEGKEYFATTDYPVHTTFYESKTGSKKIQVKLKEKTADTKFPIGKITAGTCETGLKGYACIKNVNKIVDVEIKDFGNTVIGRVQANKSETDTECGPNRWFEFEPPMSLKDNAQHSISIRAVNPDGNIGTELPGAVASLNSPLTFICSNPADLNRDNELNAQDYAIIRDAYHYQTRFDTRSVSTSSITNATAENTAIQRYLNAEGKVDLRGVAKWMVDAYTYLK